jgi:hypothetical protein
VPLLHHRLGFPEQLWRDFLGVALFVFEVAIYIMFRIDAAAANTSMPIPQPTLGNAGSMLLVTLVLVVVLVIVVVLFNIAVVVAVGRVLFGSRHVERERLLLASLLALAWSWDIHSNPTQASIPSSGFTLPDFVVAALFVWGVVANIVVM